MGKKFLIKSFIFIFVFSVLLFAYSNCSDVRLNSKQSPNSESTIQSKLDEEFITIGDVNVFVPPPNYTPPKTSTQNSILDSNVEGCVVYEKPPADNETGFLSEWQEGDSYNVNKPPLIYQKPLQTISFRFTKAEFLREVVPTSMFKSATLMHGGIQLYELYVNAVTSITSQPCQFKTPQQLQNYQQEKGYSYCQIQLNNGGLGYRFYSEKNANIEDLKYISKNGYGCIIPDSEVYYVNVRLTTIPEITNPNSTSCTIDSCSYFLHYER